jgi:hypothetical protein
MEDRMRAVRGATRTLFLLALVAGPLHADGPVGAGTPWPFDEVTLTNGAKFQGLLLQERPDGYSFQVVRRLPGRPTLTLTTFFARQEVANLKRLNATDRATLQDKLAELDPTGASERRRMEDLELAVADWPGKPGGARRYDSDHFVLISSASEEITRRAAVRLEQIYAAFTRVLPPRHPAGRPTTILLAGQMDEYAKLAGATAGRVLNPAVYDPAANRVLCGSDLRRLGEQLAATRRHHVEQLAALHKYEAEIRKLYRNQTADRERFLGVARRQRERVKTAERANDAAFDRATRRLFAVLYHEAFHSYVATFVYPPLPPADVSAGKGTGRLPRWLNEGLAQLFETAVVEAGELRIGHADADRLDRVRDRLRGKHGGLMPMAELLRSGKETYMAAHAGQHATADRAYLTAWAVTHYLTFDRRLTSTKNFEKYLIAVNSGGDRAKAFEAWVGQDVPAFERGLRDYLSRLLPDGTLVPPMREKKPS